MYQREVYLTGIFLFFRQFFASVQVTGPRPGSKGRETRGKLSCPACAQLHVDIVDNLVENARNRRSGCGHRWGQIKKQR